VKLKEGREGKAGAGGVSPSRVGGSGVDPCKAGASGVGLTGIDARGVGSTWVDASGVNPSASMLFAFGADDRDEDKEESETSESLVSSPDGETRPRYPQYHPLESFF